MKVFSNFLKASGIPVILFSLTSPALAVKFGVVNMQKVILEVPEGKAAKETLQKEIEKKKKELEKKKKKIESEMKALAPKFKLMSDEGKMKAQQDIQKKTMQLRNEEMKSEESIKKKEFEATQKIAKKVQDIAGDIAKKEQIDIVFESNSSGLVYAKDPVDITAKVIKAFSSSKKSKKK